MTECCTICAAKQRRRVPADPTLVAGHMPLCRPCFSQSEWRTLTEPPPPPDRLMFHVLLELQQ
jgi:hypothetical protein